MSDHDTILAILELAGVPHVARHWPATDGRSIGNAYAGVPWQLSFAPGGVLRSGWGVFPMWRYDAAEPLLGGMGVREEGVPHLRLVSDAELAPRGGNF